VASTALVGGAAAAGRSAAPGEAVISPGTSGSAASVCPEGTQVVSGGFAAPEFSQDDGPSTIRTSSERVGRRGWQVTAAGLGGAPGSIVSHAYCQRTGAKGGKVKVRQASVSMEPNSMDIVVASCRNGEHAVGGGFGSPGFELMGGSHVITLSSRRLGKRAWLVEAFNPSFGDETPAAAGDLVAYAYCRARGPRVLARTVEAQVADPRGGTTIDVPCPSGTSAISGGFDGNLAIGQNGPSGTGAVESVRMPGAAGWRTSSVLVSEQGPAKATAYTYCQVG
jgi:hypothetical protein